MDYKIEKLNAALKAHDRELFAKRVEDDVIHVYRRGYGWACTGFGDGTLFYQIPSPHFIFALTDTWKPDGVPRDYGVEVVMARIKAHDLWNRHDLIEDLLKSYEKEKETVARDRKNSQDAFLYEFHSQFKKAFSDVNTSGMTDKRR